MQWLCINEYELQLPLDSPSVSVACWPFSESLGSHFPPWSSSWKAAMLNSREGGLSHYRPWPWHSTIRHTQQSLIATGWVKDLVWKKAKSMSRGKCRGALSYVTKKQKDKMLIYFTANHLQTFSLPKHRRHPFFFLHIYPHEKESL